MKARSFCLADPSRATTLRRYCLVLLSLALFSADLCAQSGAWTRKTDMPTARAVISVCVVNNKIYVIGGLDRSGGSLVSLAANEVYDPSTDTWQVKKPLPSPRSFVSTAAVDSTVYAIGGIHDGFHPDFGTSTVYAYDTGTDSWTQRANMLQPRYAASPGVVDGIIYNVGGNHTEKNCEAYNPATDRWTRKPDIPEAYGGVMVASYGGLIYGFGGGFDRTFQTLYAYDPKTDGWTQKANMPTARATSQAVVVDGKMYVLGGYTSYPLGDVLPDLEVYDPVADSWKKLPDMPFPRTMFGAAAVNGKIYTIGGTFDYQMALCDVWEYDPAFHTDIAAGNVSGTWTLDGSPYYINGEITVPNDSTLTIEPGVEVVFLGHYKLNVQGRLLAVGTQQDTIRFRAADTQTGWHGIRFEDTPSTNDTSKVFYCSLKYGNANTGSGLDRSGGAMLISRFDKVLVSHCLFDSNKQSGDGWHPPEADGGIFVFYASTTITNSTFSNNTSSKSSALGCVYCPNVIISNNVFHNNTGRYGALACCYYSRGTISGNFFYNNVATEAAGGLLIDNGGAPTIANNVIVHNQGFVGGILCYKGGKPVLIGNTIAYNTASYAGGGVGCREDGNPVLVNNIIFGNAAPIGKEVALDDESCDPVILYCDIEGGKAGIGGTGAGANYSGLYEYNIDADPLFLNPTSDDYRLSDHSPCIGAGTDSVEIAAAWYRAPAYCMGGRARPSPAGTKPDIGAYENLCGIPVVGVSQGVMSPKEFSRHQNDPHRFIPCETNMFELPKSSEVRLSVYDLLGREVSVLVNERRDAGVHEVKFDASGLPSGVYFYRMKAGDFVETKRLLLLR